MTIVLRLLFLALAVVSSSTLAWAQTTREHTIAGRAMASGSATRKVTSTDGSAEARAVVQRIIAVIGLPMTSFEVRASPEVANAQATTENAGRERLILYNPSWMANFSSSMDTPWSNWVVLAHEVGHHVAFHMDPAFPDHQAELQADYFAGFICNKLGAPLKDVQLAMAMASSDEPSQTHPVKAARVAEITKGWKAAADNLAANVIPAALPAPQAAAIAKPSNEPPQQRSALLIGNTHYKSWGTALKNPKNDVLAIGQELRRLRFATTVIYDGTAEQIATAIQDFRAEAAASDWALIYFAGTGIEVDGVNYMIPIDADEKRALFFVTDHPQMSLETAFDAVKGAKTLRLVITDSCRVDPVVELGGKGLAQVQKLKVVEPPRGVVVAYSTAAGQYAFDGDGQISPYAQALIDGLRQPGVELPTVFRRVSARVEASSSGSQIPVVLGNWPAEDLFVAPKQ